MYTVEQGARIVRLTVSGTETIKFSNKFNVFGVKGDNILASLKNNFEGDGVYSTADGDGYTIIPHYKNTDTLYLSGSGDVVVTAGNSPADCSFPKVGKGGGGSGGDGTHYKGTTTTAITNGSTTNPITIDGESYTAVFGDVVVYNYTEFVFDGTTWSEFGRPFDTTPTSGSMNAVTSDGIYKRTPFGRGTGVRSASGGLESTSNGNYSIGYGRGVKADRHCMAAFGQFNTYPMGHLFAIGNGTDNNARSNIIEATPTEFNVNGDIKRNGVSLPTPYTTMPTITESMLGQIAMYVGTTDANYTKGYFYIAASDGAAEPTYSWVPLKVQDEGVGIEDTVLYTYDSTIGTRDNIQIPESVYDFDELYLEFVTTSSGIPQSVTSAIIRQVSPNTNINISTNATADATNWLSYTIYTSTPTTITAYQNPQDKSMRLFKVIGRRYARIQPECSYTTTERKIGKWIDGSDLYQRTFVVTTLVNKQFNNAVLGTSGIDIKDVDGYIEWTYYDGPNIRTSLDYFINANDCVALHNAFTDINIKPNRTDNGFAIVEAVITIKYTKTQAQSLSANMTQIVTPTEEVTDTPDVEEDDMR